jgi:hypothetical protein|tara:strand:+ start:5643 stop:5957 length:315 start_codon:yes stop_codon:yes gene_type:complete
MAFVKNFVRWNTREEIEEDDIIEYFDIVQSVCASKIVKGITDDAKKVAIDVVIYTDEDETGTIFIHEIVLDEEIDEIEGNAISDELALTFPDLENFTFEASIEI